MNGLLATIGERVEELRDMGVVLRESSIRVAAEVMAFDAGGFMRLERCEVYAAWPKGEPDVDLLVALMQHGFLVMLHATGLDIHWTRVCKL